MERHLRIALLLQVRNNRLPRDPAYRRYVIRTQRRLMLTTGNEVPPHSLHVERIIQCSQIEAPPHSSHFLKRAYFSMFTNRSTFAFVAFTARSPSRGGKAVSGWVVLLYISHATHCQHRIGNQFIQALAYFWVWRSE